MCICGLSLRFCGSSVRSTSTSPSKKRLVDSFYTDTRPSRKIKCHRHPKREWMDGLMFSNLVYLFAGLVSIGCGQYFCAAFQIGASIASSMFHRSKETKFLLVDAIISSSLAVVFIYIALHTLKNEWYGILAIKLVQGSFCVFTWLYCGLPGGIRYEKWHQRWHYVSGFTTLSSTLFLTQYLPHFDLIMHEFLQEYMLVSEWFA